MPSFTGKQFLPLSFNTELLKTLPKANLASKIEISNFLSWPPQILNDLTEKATEKLQIELSKPKKERCVGLETKGNATKSWIKFANHTIY
jgi:hypothetical protein